MTTLPIKDADTGGASEKPQLGEQPSVSKSITRRYCKCPYCRYISVRYVQVKGHVEYQHPDEEQIVGEIYTETINE